MPENINANKVVVLTGAGVSAESGLQTFRDSDGLWNNYSFLELATPEAWRAHPQVVLEFYNERRRLALEAQPNMAHLAVAELEKQYEVVVVTQNVDDLHERAGSTNVIHLHGELVKARSTFDDGLIYDIGNKDINLGDRCEKGGQLRPHIVWFGEAIHNYDVSASHMRTAGKILVIGTSLTVYPAAGLLQEARHQAEKVIVSLYIEQKPSGFKFIRGAAAEVVPTIVETWLDSV